MSLDDFLRERLPDLLRLAIALCGHRALGEDVLQEVLLRAHRDWARIAAADSPYAYVRTMLVHEHLAQVRKWGRQVPHADLDPGRVAADHAAQFADRDDLLHRLAALPARQRAAIALRYLSGLSDDDIARSLDCSAVTVRSYISRGLATLRVQLKAELAGAPKEA
jgi:RNA polymerase sigma-70 factor (sigma-E family)